MTSDLFNIRSDSSSYDSSSGGDLSLLDGISFSAAVYYYLSSYLSTKICGGLLQYETICETITRVPPLPADDIPCCKGLHSQLS